MNYTFLVFIFILTVLSLTAQSAVSDETSSLHIRDLFVSLIHLNQALEIQLSKMDQGSQAIFVVGDTGAGKSTFINYMTGQRLTIKKSEYMNSYYLENAGSNSVTIGHDFKSKTKMPAFVTDEDGNMYIDTPGFEDTEGFKANIINAMILKRILNMFSKKKVVLLIEEKNLFVNRGQEFRSNLIKIKSIFGSECGDYMIVISKASQKMDHKAYMKKIIEDDNSVASNKNRKYFMNIIENSSVEPFYQVGQAEYEQQLQAGEWDTSLREDKKSIRACIEVLPSFKIKKIKLAFSGDNALNINHIKSLLKKQNKMELIQLNKKITKLWNQLTINELKQVRKTIHLCLSQFDLNQKHTIEEQHFKQYKLLSGCYVELISFMKVHRFDLPVKDIHQLIRNIERKIYSFRLLFDEIYVSEDGATEKEINLDVQDDLQQFNGNFLKSLKKILQAKERQEQFERQQAELRRKEEDLLRKQAERVAEHRMRMQELQLINRMKISQRRQIQIKSQDLFDNIEVKDVISGVIGVTIGMALIGLAML